VRFANEPNDRKNQPYNNDRETTSYTDEADNRTDRRQGGRPRFKGEHEACTDCSDNEADEGRYAGFPQDGVNPRRVHSSQ
jgi:hypothetical protein